MNVNFALSNLILDPVKQIINVTKRKYIVYKDNKRHELYTNFIQSCTNNNITVQDVINLGFKLMRQAKLHPHFFGNNSLLETAQYLTFFALQLPYEYNNSNYLNRTINESETKKIIELFERRISERLPVEYITHESWYSGHKFYVNEHVLVPRSIMNTRFNDFLNEMHWENYRVLDLCTGSGCIGITLALLNSKIHVDLLDISRQALEVAQININQYSLNNRVQCIQSDLFENIKDRYDIIITNPPYVTTAEYNASPDEFKTEPKIALEAGIDGLNVLDIIITNAKHYLNPNGKLIAEVGVTAAKRIKRRYPNIPFKWYKYRKPSGEEAMFGMHCVFVCDAKGLS